MKVKYRLFVRKGGMFYAEDVETRKQTSLGTKDRKEALRLLHAKNESHRAPSLNLQMGHAYLSATDPFVRLTEASFAVDGKRWTNVFPTDGLFDSKTETFRFKTAELRPGMHVLVLRVRNAAGNTGSGDVVIRKE